MNEQKKILIIDDDAATGNLLKTILEMDEHQPTTVTKVENDDIIGLLERVRPKFLVLDYHLKGKETIEYVNTIRNTPDWQHIAILMISAMDYETECLQAGANGFVVKPFNWQDISNSVNSIGSEISDGHGDAVLIIAGQLDVVRRVTIGIHAACRLKRVGQAVETNGGTKQGGEIKTGHFLCPQQLSNIGVALMRAAVSRALSGTRKTTGADVTACFKSFRKIGYGEKQI